MCPPAALPAQVRNQSSRGVISQVLYKQRETSLGTTITASICIHLPFSHSPPPPIQSGFIINPNTFLQSPPHYPLSTSILPSTFFYYPLFSHPLSIESQPSPARFREWEPRPGTRFCEAFCRHPHISVPQPNYLSSFSRPHALAYSTLSLYFH